VVANSYLYFASWFYGPLLYCSSRELFSSPEKTILSPIFPVLTVKSVLCYDHATPHLSRMFISDEELAARLTSEANLISRLNRGDVETISSSIPLPPLPVVSEIFEEEMGPISPAAPLDPCSPVEILPAEEFSAESLDKLLNPRILKNGKEYSGRGPKGLHVDEQAAIGVAAGILGTTKGSHLGDVTYASGHSFRNGYEGNHTQYDPRRGPKEELREKIIGGHGVIVDKCFNRLLATLDLLDDNKLSQVKRATELSIVAKNLSGIIASASAATQDKFVDQKEQSVHFHIMRPEPALHDDYPTINIDSSPDLPKDPS